MNILFAPWKILHPVLAPAGENILAVVQDDQAVFPGQTVMYTTAYADPNQACH